VELPPPIGGVCPDPPDTPAFPDVSRHSVHVHAIDCAAHHDIARGYADDTYRPALSVRRDQMASFVVRALQAAGHTLPAADHGFTDVTGNAHETAIGQLAAAGIVRGQTVTGYAPAHTVTRDQMASYLIRAADWALDTTHGATDSPFTDIAGNTHKQAVHTAYDLGLVSGRIETTYAPHMEVRRDQMASFLVRLLPVTMRTD
jgi:lysozyme